MNNEAYIEGFVKRANEYGVSTEKAVEILKLAAGELPMPMQHIMNMQQYAPMHQQRELGPAEQQQIQDAQGKIIPKIFKSNKDPISADMASPGWSAAGGAALGAIPGTLLGTLLGGMASAGSTVNHGMGKGTDFTGLGAGLGLLAGGGIGGAIGYHNRNAKNQTLEDYMSRFPEGATRRDLASDPVYQKQIDRDLMLRMAKQKGGSPYQNPYL